MNSRAWKVAPLLFCSGLCSLVYQIAWLKEFRLVFGASTAASAAVVAIFIAGLGIGGVLLGRRADRHPQPLLLYAHLETFIALSAALTPGLLWLTRQAYMAAGGTVALGLGGGTVVRLLLAALVLAVPTWLMGGTLPAVARAVSAADDAGRRGVALLYGVNTLGAVTGCFLANFLLLELYGTRLTLWLACLVNILVALAARAVARTLPPQAEDPVESVATPAEDPGVSPRFVLAAAAVVGFAFFLMELVWYRMLAPLLGGSVFTFGLILAVALLGIGLGGATYSLGRNRPATLTGFANTCLLEAMAIVLPFALGDRIAILALGLRSLGNLGGFWGQVLGWTIVCKLVVLPAAFIAGYQFPLLIALLGRGSRRVGQQVGLAYAWNTAGAIAGSLAGGFGLIPLLSAPTAWRSTALLLAALGILALALSARGKGARPAALSAAAMAALVVALSFAQGPTAAWRHGAIGAGRAPEHIVSPNKLTEWLHNQRRIVMWEADGFESSIALEASGPGFAFVVNGKIDSNSRSDAPTTVMSGLVGALLHGNARRSMVVGLGTGATAGWLAAIPGMERTDVVELERVVLDVARDCAPVNRDVLNNPKIRITIGDAREVLLVSRERYDVIFSEPSNPYRAGIASLFTREFYEAVKKRLAEGGIFLQWVQAYEIDSQTVRTIFATMGSSFPNVETWQVGPGDLLLVAADKPMTYDVAALRRRLMEEPYRSGALATWRVTDLEGVLAFFVGDATFTRAVAAKAGPQLNTDDRNTVEFGFARSVGRTENFSINELREVARALQRDRPAVAGGDVDWRKVDDDRVRFYPLEGQAPFLRAQFTPERRILAMALAKREIRDTPAALAAFRQLGREPQSLTELTLVAEGLSYAGSDAALGYIEQMRALQPTEAEAILARLLFQQGRVEDATAALEKAFAQYHSDPWPSVSAMPQAFDLAAEIGQRDPRLAPRLIESLKKPFVVYADDDQRESTVAELVARLDLKTSCLTAVIPLEPHFQWTKNWLTLRRDCYVATGDKPMAAKADADLKTFVSQEPKRFADDLGLVLKP